MSKPNIATKNLSAITELLIAENLQYKKCIAYSSQVQDPDLQATLDHMAECHRNRYDGLLDYLDSHQ
ncbi:MAG: hypothetical protein FWF56_03700 [Firmicutes bacterium]|nr:hypothetical protein [Bacillota bacterium]MCL1953871.1 hypothetical protein [Bacillota bacterium]